MIEPAIPRGSWRRQEVLDISECLQLFSAVSVNFWTTYDRTGDQGGSMMRARVTGDLLGGTLEGFGLSSLISVFC